MKIRIITAIAAILFFFPFLFIGGWPFYIIMTIIASIGLFELFQMRAMTDYPIPILITMFLLWTLLFPNIDAFSFFQVHQQEILLGVTFLLLGYTVLVKNKFTFEDAGFMVITAIYIGLGFHYFIETQRIGLEYVFFAIIVILATDVGAYFSGRYFGNNKLWPEISPKKTIEGAIGGMILAVVLGTVFHLIFPVHTSILVVMVVALLSSVVGQIGDLVESAFKRYYNVKDSGKLLPGHGGILDRFDSWLLVFPFLYFIQFLT